MARATTIYLVRHAESQPSADVREPEWPLSALGEEQARALVPAMRSLGIDRLYSSPYPRALHTITPLAAALGKQVIVEHELHERVLARSNLNELYWPTIELYWRDVEFALPDGESNRACAERMVKAIDQLAARHPGEVLALASHSNALALYLGTIDRTFGYEEWRAMRNPDLFCIRYEAGRASWDGTRLPVA
jgi:2,3-bisphosphoglycerate-dependent phosphoglycerate mutase